MRNKCKQTIRRRGGKESSDTCVQWSIHLWFREGGRDGRGRGIYHDNYWYFCFNSKSVVIICILGSKVTTRVWILALNAVCCDDNNLKIPDLGDKLYDCKWLKLTSSVVSHIGPCPHWLVPLEPNEWCCGRNSNEWNRLNAIGMGAIITAQCAMWHQTVA